MWRWRGPSRRAAGVYRGSYILTFAAYNAGPGRVRQWLDMFGDPRDPSVDPVDFVESIPVTETRRYVQRVMQNVQVYRSRLKDTARSLRSDLERGRSSGGARKPWISAAGMAAARAAPAPSPRC